MAEQAQRPISDDLYSEMHESFFANGGNADKYFTESGMAEQRRADIEDTFKGIRSKFAEIFPETEDIDPDRIDRAATLAAFFERTGFEDGIDFWAKNKPYDAMSAESVLRRRHTLGV